MHAYFDRLDQKFFKVEFPGGAKEQYTASSELTQPLFSWSVCTENLTEQYAFGLDEILTIC